MKINLFYDRFGEDGKVLVNGSLPGMKFEDHPEALTSCGVYPSMENAGVDVACRKVRVQYDYTPLPEQEINIYPVDLWVHMNFDTVIDNISEQAKILMRERDLILYLTLSGEAFGCDERNWIIDLTDGIVRNNLTDAKIAIQCADMNFEANYDAWLKNNQVSYTFRNVFSLDFFQWTYSKQFQMRTGRWSWDNNCPKRYNSKDVMSPNEVLHGTTPGCEKTGDLLCLNGMSRPHRIATVAELHRLGCSNDFVSLLWRYQDINNLTGLDTVKNHIMDNLLETVEQKEYFNEYFDINPNNIQPHPGILEIDLQENIFLHDDRRIQLSHYTKTFFSLVTETAFDSGKSAVYKEGFTSIDTYDNNITFITEKTFKPIAYFHPFIIMGSLRSLEYLRKSGYETFPEMFDEKYDTIENPKDRFNAVIEQVRLWKEKTQEEKITIYDSVIPKLVHNHNTFRKKSTLLNAVAFEDYRKIGSALL